MQTGNRPHARWTLARRPHVRGALARPGQLPAVNTCPQRTFAGWTVARSKLARSVFEWILIKTVTDFSFAEFSSLCDNCFPSFVGLACLYEEFRLYVHRQTNESSDYIQQSIFDVVLEYSFVSHRYK